MSTPVSGARQLGCGLIAAVLVIGNLFLHEPISDVCERWVQEFGWYPYNEAMLVALAGVCVLAVIPFVVRMRGAILHFPSWGPLLGLIGLTMAIHRWLLVANVELVHLPQFALLTWGLLAAGVPPLTAWRLAVTAGIVDETYQQAVIYAGRSDTYLDFNDMFLNAVGVTWAVFLWTRAGIDGAAAGPPARSSWGTAYASWTAFGGAMLLLLWLDPPVLTPLLRPTATGKVYHVMSAPEAVLLSLPLWWLVAAPRSSEVAAATSSR